jgi:hypothetical protein
MKEFLASILHVENRLREVGGAQLSDRADQCSAWANEVNTCPGVLSDERRVEIDDALDEFLRIAAAADPQITGLTRVAFRKRGGKVHKGVLHEGCNRPSAVCGCPGAHNGSLAQGAEILAEGPDAWKISNCCPNERPRKRRDLKPLVASNKSNRKEAIVPTAAKSEMRWARQCRAAARGWADGERKGTETEIYRSVAYFEDKAAAHERKAAEIIRENERAMAKRKEEANWPKAAKLLIAQGKATQARAEEWARLGNKGGVRTEKARAADLFAQAARIIDDKAAKAAAKIARAELKERLADGSATTRERLDAMPKAKLLKVARIVGLRRADDVGRDFSKMSANGLRLKLFREFFPAEGRPETVLSRVVRDAMDEVEGVVCNVNAGVRHTSAADKRAELAAEDKANADFAEFAEERDVYDSMSQEEINGKNGFGGL